MPTYVSGKKAKVFAGATELPTFKWTASDKANTKDVSNSRDGRFRIEGLNDAEGSFDMHLDADTMPTDGPPNLRKGTILTIKKYVSTTRFISCTIIIDEVTWSSEIEGTVDYSGKWMLQSGDMIYP